MRALSVLVVATPCPLILAVPIAIVAGISRAAKRGIIVKGGGALETLARVDDPAVRQDRHAHLRRAACRRRRGVRRRSSPDELLRLAASLDQVSPHVLATAIVRAARERGSELSFPAGGRRAVRGRGSAGLVDGRSDRARARPAYVAGGASLPRARTRRPPPHDARRLLVRVRRRRRRGRRRAS